ncbi:MAG: hypothetical protein AB1567_00720 [bacterium]
MTDIIPVEKIENRIFQIRGKVTVQGVMKGKMGNNGKRGNLFLCIGI